jgi:hypothetical protein
LAAIGFVPAAWAQTVQKRRIGFLSNFTEAGGAPLVGCFEQALAGFGWRQGENLDVTYRWAGGRAEAYSPFAEELLALDLDLIAVNSTPATQALKRASAMRVSAAPAVLCR